MQIRMEQHLRSRAWRLVNKPLPRKSLSNEDVVSTDCCSSSDAECFSSGSSECSVNACHYPVTSGNLAIIDVHLPRRNVSSSCCYSRKTVVEPNPGTPAFARVASAKKKKREKEDEISEPSSSSKSKSNVRGTRCSMPTSGVLWGSRNAAMSREQAQDSIVSSASAAQPLLYGPVSVRSPSPRRVSTEAVFAKAKTDGYPLKVVPSTSFGCLSQQLSPDLLIGAHVFDIDRVLPVKKRPMTTGVAIDALTLAANSLQPDLPVNILVREGFFLGETTRVHVFGYPPGLAHPAR